MKFGRRTAVVLAAVATLTATPVVTLAATTPGGGGCSGVITYYVGDDVYINNCTGSTVRRKVMYWSHLDSAQTRPYNGTCYSIAPYSTKMIWDGSWRYGVDSVVSC